MPGSTSLRRRVTEASRYKKGMRRMELPSAAQRAAQAEFVKRLMRPIPGQEGNPRLLSKWIISDTHFGHQTAQWDFNRPPDWEERTRRNWRERVAPADALLHLGDVALDIHPGELAAAVADLPGRVLVVRGNWDTDGSLEALKDAGWTVSHWLLWTEYRGWLLQFTHEPLSADELDDYDRGFRGALNVHGHVHNAAPVSDRHINVSLEPMGYRPVLLKELVDMRIDELET